MLSKEECEKALRNICETVIDSEADGHNQPRTVSDYCFSDTDILEQLIHEHFDNPPLSFDDLHEGMWVWDDKHSFYDQIISLHSPTPSSIETETWFTSFEENRFYRRQKEN